MGHLQYQISKDGTTLGRLAAAVDRRHQALAHTAGLNEEVFDALILLAAGDWSPGGIAKGFSEVQRLKQEMDADREARLTRLGFPSDEAAALSALHTRNFM
jgi:hypothetical protein